MKLQLLLLVLSASVSVVAGADLQTRSASAAGVTVKVTPTKVARGAPTWDFEIVLDTHSQDLSDDLVKNAVLVDAKGSKHAPLAWEGTGPGGHHRQGVLRFKALQPAPDSIELQIRRPGEAGPRSFRWTLK